RFLPVRTPGQAFLLGLLWGWLPCGLVYSVLVWSISRGDAIEGGMLMLSFGLGTLPTLLLMGVAATRLSAFVRHVWVRRAAGMLVMSLGLWTLYPLLSG
ncbi:MAG TPA: sulfite exporter TauE/SafE family protein, partial [Gammaproteobacteria bacterium]|nr:sulfite exporter TauE/SafE family protein [Gammaproteobacteria bacterium]